MFRILKVCEGGGYRYARTEPRHPKANAKGLYPLHRVKMENKLGRLLEADEIVHHRDGDTTNDDDDNLEVMLNPHHSSHHARLRAPDPVRCVCACGVTFAMKPAAFRLAMKRNKSGAVHCSRRCGGRYTHSSGKR